MLVAQNWLSRLLRGVNPSWDGVSAEEMDAAFVRVGFETEGFEPIPETTGPLVPGTSQRATWLWWRFLAVCCLVISPFRLGKPMVACLRA